jgi:hypothetical protein
MVTPFMVMVVLVMVVLVTVVLVTVVLVTVESVKAVWCIAQAVALAAAVRAAGCVLAVLAVDSNAVRFHTPSNPIMVRMEWQADKPQLTLIRITRLVLLAIS